MLFYENKAKTPRTSQSVITAAPVTLYRNTQTDVLWVYLTIISLSRLRALILCPKDISSIGEFNATGLGVHFCFYCQVELEKVNMLYHRVNSVLG